MKLSDGPRWLALALLLSLGGNTFLGGYVLGHRPPFPHRDGPPPFGPPPFGFPDGPPPGPPGGPGGPPGPEHLIERLAERLPPADAAVLRATLGENRGFFEAEESRRRDFPRRLRDALGREPFEAAAFEKVLADHDDAEYAAHQTMRAALVKAAAALSPEARRQLMSFGPRP